MDDGALLLVAKDDRALRIEVGYGLEGALPDATANRIVEDIIVPRFKTGDFYGGIDAGVDAMIKVVDGEPLPPPQTQWRSPSKVNGGNLHSLFIVGMILVFVVGGILRSVVGRLPAAGLIGGAAGVIAWFLVSSVVAAAVAGVIAFIFTLISGGTRGGRGGYGGWTGGGGRLWRWWRRWLQRWWRRVRRRWRVGQVVSMDLKRICPAPVHHDLERAPRISSVVAAMRSTRAIKDTEATHEGQVRFAVEHALDLQQLLSGRSARERALDVFSELRVWDTEHNNGVLIYLLLADRDVEIIADRGVHAHVGGGWEGDLPQHGTALRPGRIRGWRRSKGCAPSESICSGTSRRGAAAATSFPINPWCSEPQWCLEPMEACNLQQLIEHYGYLAVFIGALIEGETILVMAGLPGARGLFEPGRGDDGRRHRRLYWRSILLRARAVSWTGDSRPLSEPQGARGPRREVGAPLSELADHLDSLHVRTAGRRTDLPRHDSRSRTSVSPW